MDDFIKSIKNVIIKQDLLENEVDKILVFVDTKVHLEGINYFVVIDSQNYSNIVVYLVHEDNFNFEHKVNILDLEENYFHDPNQDIDENDFVENEDY